MPSQRQFALKLAVAVWTAGTLAAEAQTGVNAGAALDADFLNRVGAYVKERAALAAGLATANARPVHHDITARQQELAGKIREVRATAKQGDLFDPAIAAEMRRLIGLAMQGADAARIRRSLRSADRVFVPLVINGSLPETLPMPSVPPTLLANLPRLPAEVEYRLLRGALVLHDRVAGIIIDFVPNALPEN